MTLTKIEEKLKTRDWLLADGATGTNLFTMGLEAGYPPELWNIEHPEKIRALYRGFIEAGSDIILTNTFGGSRHRLKLHDAQDRVYELNKIAVELALDEVKKSGKDVIVVGSMGPTGEILEPVGALSYKDAVEAFKEQALGLKDGGADVAWIETMSAENEAAAAVEGCAAVGLKVVTTMSFDTAGRTMMGIAPKDWAKISENFVQNPVAIGANCGVGASELIATVMGIAEGDETGHINIVAKGNCGMPHFVDGECTYTGTPEVMANYARLAFDAGARIIGGCCGTRPEHVKAMREALEQHQKGEKPSIETIIEVLGEVSDLAKGKAAGASSRGGERRRKRA